LSILLDKLKISWIFALISLVLIFKLPSFKGIAYINFGYLKLSKAILSLDISPPAKQDRAEEYFLRASLQPSFQGRANAGLGMLAYSQSDYISAIEYLTRAVKIYNDNPILYYLLGISWEETGYHANALDAWRLASANRKFTAQGDRLYVLGNLESASDYYRLALDIDPEFKPAKDNLLRVFHELFWEYRRNEEFDQAVLTMEEVLDINQSIDDYLLLGDYLYEYGDLKLARRWYDEGKKAYPQDAVFYERLGRLSIKEKDLSTAEYQLQQAILKDPELCSAYRSLGIVLMRQERFVEAEDVLFKAMEIEKNNPWNYTLLGDVYIAKRDIIKAQYAFKEALRISPSLEYALLRLSELETLQ